MLKIIYLNLLFVVIISYISSAQNELKLHVVMFTSEDIPTNFFDPRLGEEGDQDSTLLSILWVLDADSLRSLDTLNLNPFGTISNMQHCRHFASEKWIYIQEREYTPTFLTERSKNLKDIYDGNEDTYISVLDYSSDTIVVRRMVGEKYDPFGSTKIYHRAFRKKDLLYYTYSYDDQSDNYGNYINNKFLDDGHEVDRNTYQNRLYVKYESGLFFRIITGYITDKNNNYKARVYDSNKYESSNQWPINNLNIPTSDSESELYKYFGLMYATENSKVVIGKKKRWKKNSDSLEIYYHMNKNNFGVWDTILLPKDVNTFNVHEDRYLYGTHINSDILGKYNPKRNRDSTLSYMGRYPEKYSWKYANYPNLIYSKGVIFIYDLEARKYYELQLPDRDSEFLQIIDGWIYLRVYDEIWRMPLNIEGNPFRLEEKEVLIKDKAVIPNVHHIFLKEKSPVVEKWITSKP